MNNKPGTTQVGAAHKAQNMHRVLFRKNCAFSEKIPIIRFSSGKKFIAIFWNVSKILSEILKI